MHLDLLCHAFACHEHGKIIKLYVNVHTVAFLTDGSENMILILLKKMMNLLLNCIIGYKSKYLLRKSAA